MKVGQQNRPADLIGIAGLVDSRTKPNEISQRACEY